jgi:hypothetical protein
LTPIGVARLRQPVDDDREERYGGDAGTGHS